MPAIREIHATDTACAYRAMRELRTRLSSLEEFVSLVDVRQRPQGYRLVGSFDENASDAVAVAGFRTGHSLHRGDYLYVDDLVTRAEHRARGHGRALMAWLVDEAVRLGCTQLHLDSGVQRRDAHRFYGRCGMTLSAYHFDLELRADGR